MQFNAIKALIVLLIISLSSCEKHTEEILSDAKVSESKLENQITPPNFEEKDGRIAFASITDYENAMKSEIEFPKVGNLPNSFFSNARVSSETEDILNEVPEKLLAKLNDDFVMQVGEWVLKLDFFNYTVYAVQAENAKSQYENLVAGSTNQYVYEFSMEYDVLDLLEQGFTKVPDGSERTEGIFCGGGEPATENYGNREKAYYGQGGIYLFDYQSISQYKKFGVWFELSSVIRLYSPTVYDPVTGKWVKTYQNEYFNRNVVWYYKQNCRNGKTRSGSSAWNDRAYTTKHPITGKIQDKLIIYDSTRGLRDFTVDSKYSPAVRQGARFGITSSSYINE